MPAPTLNRALVVRNTVRPALVVTDADLADGRAVALIRALRAVPALEEVCVVVLGRVTPAEVHDLAGEPYVDVPQVSDNEAIGGLLEQLRAA